MTLISRRQLIVGASGVFALAACNPGMSKAKENMPSVAITIDDFVFRNTPLMSAAQSDEKIRNALKAHNMLAGAFPAGKYVEKPAVRAAIEKWSQEGHLIGNHSFSHGYYSGKNPEKMMDDILKAEALLADLPTYEKYIRFPYLAEGRTDKGRDALRTLLAQNNYINAHVTIDASDWFINDRLKAALRRDPKTDIAPYKTYYLAHIWERAVFYHQLAKDMTGRDNIAHTLLIHQNLLNALFLGDLLDMFKNNGWRLSNIKDTFKDPIYQKEPKSLPAGQSLIWAMARESGEYEDRLRYPAEDGRYEKDAMDALGL